MPDWILVLPDSIKAIRHGTIPSKRLDRVLFHAPTPHLSGEENPNSNR